MNIKLKDLIQQDARDDIKKYAKKINFNITDQFIDQIQQRVNKKDLKTIGKWYLQIAQKHKSDGLNIINSKFEHLMDVYNQFNKEVNTREGKNKINTLGKVITNKDLLKKVKAEYKIPPNISEYKDVWKFLQLIEQLLVIFYHYDNNRLYYGKDGQQSMNVQIPIEVDKEEKTSYKQQYIDRLKFYMGKYYLGKHKRYSIFVIPNFKAGVMGIWTNSWCTSRGTDSFYKTYSSKGYLITFIDVQNISNAYNKYKTLLDEKKYNQADKWLLKKHETDTTTIGSQIKGEWGYQVTAIIQPGFYRLVRYGSSYQGNDFRDISIDKNLSMQLLKALKNIIDKNPSLMNVIESCKRHSDKGITKQSIAPWQLLIDSNIDTDETAISFDGQKGSNNKIAGVIFKSGWYDLKQLNEDNIFFTQAECLTNKNSNGKVQLRNLNTKSIQIRVQGGDFELTNSNIDQLTIVLDKEQYNCNIKNCNIGNIFIDDMVINDNIILKNRGKVTITGGSVNSIEGVNMYDYLGFPVTNVIDKTNCNNLQGVLTNVSDQDFEKYQSLFNNKEQFTLNQSVNYDTIINKFRIIL